MNNPVNSPAHYIGKHWECIEIIEAFGLDFHRGNAIKYIARHKQKGGNQDIAKAMWYLRRAVDDSSVAAWLSYSIAPDHAMASEMTADAIAENFGITDENLIVAISTIRDSAFSALPRAEVEELLILAINALRRYLVASQAHRMGHPGV